MRTTLFLGINQKQYIYRKKEGEKMMKMTIVRVSILISACVSSLLALEEADSLICEEELQVHPLKNGISVWLHPNSFPQKSASLRMVIKRSSDENVVFALDTHPQDMDAMDRFFDSCRQQLHSTMPLKGPVEKEKSYQAIPKGGLEDIAIIAVGDFESEEMLSHIRSYFENLNVSAILSHPVSMVQVGHSPLESGIELHIDYPMERQELKTYADLEQRWKQILAQLLLQQRLERSTRFLKENWIHPHRQFINPVHGFAWVSEEDYANVLTFLLWEIEQIKADGFSLNEFLTLKESTLHKLTRLSLNSGRIESSWLASFYADLTPFNASCVAYSCFVDQSLAVVANLQFNDIQPWIDQLMEDNNRFVHVRYPCTTVVPKLTTEGLEEVVKKISEFSDWEENGYFGEEEILLLNHRVHTSPKRIVHKTHNPFEMLEPEELQPSKEDGDPFLSLPLTDVEQKTIAFIIQNMADKNIFELALEKRKMEEKGKQINHVHPLRFIGCIFSDYELTKALKKVRKSTFKWDAFVDGFVKRMKEEHSKNNLLPYITGFAKEVNVLEEKVLYYIQEKNWKGLIDYLM